jgi:O-antigen ligase
MPGTTGGAPVPAARLRLTGMLLFTYFLWFVVVADPQWWIASFGPQIVLRIPTLLFATILVLTLARGPRHLFPPLLSFLAFMVLTLPLAYIPSLSLGIAKGVFAYYVLALATLTVVRTAREAVPIVLWGLLFQYVWWVVLGAKNGLVPWHYSYANYDGFGPMMVVGMASTFYMGMATKNPRLRALAFFTAGGCLIGLISSFARGAVVSGVAVALWLWIRSRQKLRATLLGIAAAIVLMVSTTLFFSNVSRGDAKRSFWAEMSTMLSLSSDATKTDREILWGLARRVYAARPLFGVGPGCFGPYAAENLNLTMLGGYYGENPGRLWNKALHNTYYQILSEFGTIGSIIFLWMLWDFFKRNRSLRQPGRIRAWAAATGGRLNLMQVSLALEAAMVGFLTTGYFYNQIFDVHWLYTLLTINALLFQVTRPSSLARANNARAAHEVLPANGGRRRLNRF